MTNLIESLKKGTLSQLQSDMEKLVSELSVQGDLIKTKDE
jgi:hypothetical protein